MTDCLMRQKYKTPVNQFYRHTHTHTLNSDGVKWGGKLTMFVCAASILETVIIKFQLFFKCTALI